MTQDERRAAALPKAQAAKLKLGDDLKPLTQALRQKGCQALEITTTIRHPRCKFDKMFLELRKGTNLTSLRLQDSIDTTWVFPDSNIKLLKTGLRTFASLKHLSFECSLLYDPGLKVISMAMKPLINLQSFSLCVITRFVAYPASKISDAGMKDLSEVLRTLTSLTSFHLKLTKDISITNTGMKYLIGGFKTLLKLNSLSLDIQPSHFSPDDVMQELSTTFKNLTSLTCVSLHFGHARFSVSSCRALENLHNLRSLAIQLHWDPATRINPIEALSMVLENLKSLRTFDLDLSFAQNLNKKTMREVATALKTLTSLTGFIATFDKMYVDDGALKELVAALKTLPNLTRLDITSYQDFRETITNSGAKALSKLIEHLPNLKALRIRLPFCRSISERGRERLAAAIKAQANIVDLDLHLSEVSRDSSKDLHMTYKILMVSVNLFCFTLTQKVEELVPFLWKINGIVIVVSVLYIIYKHISGYIWERRGLQTGMFKEVSTVLTSCNKLERVHINLSRCEAMSDDKMEELGAALRTCKDLQVLSLDLTHCSPLSDRGIRALKEALESLPRLKNVHFRTVSGLNLKSLHEMNESFRSSGIENVDFYPAPF